MYRKLLIYIFCVVLTGTFLMFGQDSQQTDVQQNMRRPGDRVGMNRSERPDRGQTDGRPDAERGIRGMRGDRGNRPSRGDNMGGPPMPGQQPPRQEYVQQSEPTELEAVEEEDDTKSPLYGTPYQVIVKRNLFALKAGAGLGTAVTNIVPVSLSTNNLKFMGITTIGGVIKSHFMINKPGQQPPQQYISLTEGQASEGLECLKINPDPVNPTAEVRADGKQIEVSFETHGIKAGAPATPAPNNRPNAQQQQQGGRGPGQQPGRMPGQQGQTQQQAQGGFNLPAVNAANTVVQAAPPPRPGQYTGWAPPGGGGSVSRTVGQTSGGTASSSGNNNYRRNMPMTQEANSYRNRGGNSSGGFSGGGNMPPMPPGM